MGRERYVATEATTKNVPSLLDQSSAVALATALRACLRLHRQMGIECYPATPGLRAFLQPCRQGAAAKPVVAAAPPSRPAAASAAVTVAPALPADDHLDMVRREIEACALCPRGEATATRLPGQGPVGAPLLVLGDYCGEVTAAGMVFGAEEDALLWKMMQAIGLGPESVYCTNVLKCPCAEAMKPLGEQACLGYVQREIALVQPRLLLAMGAVAARAALGREVSLVRVRGRLHPSRFVDRAGHPLLVMVSFHPRSLLEQPGMKKAAWQDLQEVQRKLATHALTGHPPVSGG